MKNSTHSDQSLLYPFLKNCLTVLLLASCFIARTAPVDSTQETGREFHPTTIVFTQQPSATTVCEGSNTSFTIAATGSGTLSYQWQVSTDGGSTWNAVTNGSLYAGTTTGSLQITAATFAMNAWRYRCNVSDGSSSNSSSAMLTVNAAPTVQSSNIAIQVCISGSATITASSYAGLNYQWQVNTGSGFVNVVNGGVYTGASTTALKITGVPISMEGYLYRYVATNATSLCTASSGLDTLHVLPYSSISRQPVSATVCPGFDTSFTVVATGVSSIKWQVSTNGSTWNDVPNNATYSGATNPTLEISSVNLSMNNYRYRAVLSNALSCAVSSSTVFLFVRTVTAITSQPSNTTVCATNAASFSVAATGSTLTYQWQSDNGTNGSTWTNISPGGTASTLTLTSVTMSMNGWRYRAIVTGFCGSLVSSEATLQTKRGTWLGAISTDWQTAGNWCGGVPDNTTDVLIPAAAPRMPDIISGIGYSRAITIEAGAKLTVSGGTTQMSGPFSIPGTVAYTGTADQYVLPAAHGSLEIDGSDNKYLQSNVDVSNDLVLNGSAKLVTLNYLLTLKAGSNPITGTDLTNASTSWIVTGNGNTGAANTGLGGLQYEDIKNSDGSVIFPVGPTTTAYNPLFLQNTGVRDQFSVSVNDQPIPGSFIGRTINRTWKVTEGTPGGSRVVLDMKWNKPEEQPQFDSAHVMMVRGAGGSIVEKKSVTTPNGRPFARKNETDFFAMTEFSLHTVYMVDGVYLPVKISSFDAQKLSDKTTLIIWSVEDATGSETFTVQRSSLPDQGFVNIGSMKSEAGKRSYSFTDEKLQTGLSYYRMKILQADGSLTYSPVAKIVNGVLAEYFELRPSIISGTNTQLYFTLGTKQRISISLSNASGQVMWTRTINADAGSHIELINVSGLSKGMYYLRIGRTAGSKILSLIKS